MGITKELLLKLGLDDKQAEAVLKKFRDEAEKPAKMELNIDTKSLDEAMQGLNKFFAQLQKGLGKGKGFEALSQSLLKVSDNIDKVITTTKEVSAINVNPVGLDETKKQIEAIVNSLKEMAAIKPDADFFTVVRNSLEGINALVQSICTGMNFDNIHPSPYFLKQIDELTAKMGKLESSKKSLEAIQEQYQKTVINEETGETITKRPTNRAAVVAREYATSGNILDYEDSKSIAGVKESLSYMKDYIRLGGQLKDVSVTANKSLADVFSAMRADSTLNGNSNIKQMIDEVTRLQQVSNQLAEARKNLQVAQARENRDIVATFDTTSVESFSNAIKSAVSELNHLDIKIPEGTKITGLSDEGLNNLLEKLDAISKKLLEIHDLMQKAFDTSELQAEMKEAVSKTPIKVDVEPELTDPAGFVNKVEKQLAGHKVKLGIDLTDAQKETINDRNKNQGSSSKKSKKKTYDVEKLRKDLSSALKDNPISDFGNVTSVAIQKNGSAVVKFLKTIEGQAETTKIKIKDVESALLKLSSGNLAKSVDYEVLASGEKKTKTTSSSATKIDTRQFKAGFEAKVKSSIGGELSAKELQDLAVYEQALQKISHLLGQVSADTSKATEEQKQYIAALKEASDAMLQKVATDYTKFSGKSDGKIDAYQNLLNNYKEKMNSLRTLVTSEGFSFSNEKDVRTFNEILLEIKNINTELSNSKKYTAASSAEIERLSKQLQNWKVKNSKAMTNSDFSKQFKSIENRLKLGISKSDLEELTGEFYKLDASVSKAGKTGKSFFDSWKTRAKGLVSYLTTFASFYDVINILREGVQVVRELDGAFVEMQKVSNDSLSSLKEYAKESFALGDSVGTTGKQMQESAADWMRIGESLAQAKESAETSNILLNVSEFDNIDSATESLVSASQAYKDLDKIEIVDKLNNIGNNFSISTDGLATALQKSASALTTAGKYYCLKYMETYIYRTHLIARIA